MGERERGPEPGGDPGPADQLDAPGVPGPDTPLSGLAVTALSDSPLRLAHRRGQRAALRQKLDEKAAATDELRAALHELRQVLDVDNPPPPVNLRRRRTRLAALAIAMIVVTALLLWLLLGHDASPIVAATPSSGASSSAPAPAAGSPASGPAKASASASASPSLTVRPLPWPGGAVLTPPGLTTAGTGASDPGTDVQVAVDPDKRHLDVFERLRLDAATGEPLTLATSTLPALRSGVGVQDLQVQLDDQAVPVTADSPSSWRATPPAGHTYTRATLRYRVSGGVARVTPAAPGRALGFVTPLTGLISVGHGHAVQVRAVGAGVLGITCPTAARGAVCGSRTSTGWVATVPPDATPIVVLLQLNTRR